jgi:hypothetical protein
MKQRSKLLSGKLMKKVRIRIYYFSPLFCSFVFVCFLAGVRGKITGFIGSFVDYNSYGEAKGNVWFYEFEVEEILDIWPEMKFRERKWVTTIFTYPL